MINRFLVVIVLAMPLIASGQEYEKIFRLFVNSAMPGNYFFSSAKSSASSVLKNDEGRLPVSEAIFHTPGNSLELRYRNGIDGNWEAAVYCQQKRGIEQFARPSFLSLWIFCKSEIKDESELPEIKFIKKDSTLSAKARIPDLEPGIWQRVLIPLDSVAGLDFDYPENIIGIMFSRQDSPVTGDHTLYVDDVELVPEITAGAISQAPVITSATGYAMHIDLTWGKVTDPSVYLVKIYRSENGEEYQPAGIQKPYINRYTDFTGETGVNYSYRISFLNSNYEETILSTAVEASTGPMSDEALLTMVQEASFRYYWEGAEPFSGMARENIPGSDNMIAVGASGFGIMALIVATERNFITREESMDHITKILTFLGKADTFHGAYPHFIDGKTGKAEPYFGRADNGADLVETSFLLQGLLAARQYFSGVNEQEKWIRDRITEIWEKVEWDWFRKTPDSKFLYWHWSPDQAWVINHPLIGWNETMVTYLLAIASPTHPVDAGMYYSGWANQDSTGIRYRSNWGQTADGSTYANGKTYYGIRLDVGVSNGGPLFFTHYSYMGYDPRLISDKYTNYFDNNQRIAQINYRYCVSNPLKYKGYNENSWGLTASIGPYDYSADEPVVWQDHGKISPTGAMSSFPYTPVESMRALKNFYYNYGKFLWGEYGFRDAFNLTCNWRSEIYMGLNQAPMTVMIENYRTGLVWKLFMQDQEIINGLKRISSEK